MDREAVKQGLREWINEEGLQVVIDELANICFSYAAMEEFGSKEHTAWDDSGKALEGLDLIEVSE